MILLVYKEAFLVESNHEFYSDYSHECFKCGKAFAADERNYMYLKSKDSSGSIIPEKICRKCGDRLLKLGYAKLLGDEAAFWG